MVLFLCLWFKIKNVLSSHFPWLIYKNTQSNIRWFSPRGFLETWEMVACERHSLIIIDHYWFQIKFTNENSSVLIYGNICWRKSKYCNVNFFQYCAVLNALFENFLPCADTQLLFCYSGQLKPLPFTLHGPDLLPRMLMLKNIWIDYILF